MRRAPRGIWLLALATTAGCILPRPGRAAEPGDAPLDYATVGRVVARFVDGRTVVVVPVSGTLRPRLSEPVRAGKRWRLDLVIEDAKLSIAAPVRRPEGLASLTVEEVGSDVRVSVEVNTLGDYGARRSEEGMLLWVDAERRQPVAAAPQGVPASIPVTGVAEAVQPGVRPAQVPQRQKRTNWVGMIGLAVAAAATGAAFRQVRRNGPPDWAVDLGPRLRGLLPGAAAAAGPEPGGVEPTDEAQPRVPFGAPPADPRGRSEEIGDAFRVKPDKPASGIAALVATNDNEAE